MDRVLSSSSDFLLGTWLEQAKQMATTDAERQLFEINARNQITIWGPKAQIVNQNYSENQEEMKVKFVLHFRLTMQ